MAAYKLVAFATVLLGCCCSCTVMNLDQNGQLQNYEEIVSIDVLEGLTKDFVTIRRLLLLAINGENPLFLKSFTNRWGNYNPTVEAVYQDIESMLYFNTDQPEGRQKRLNYLLSIFKTQEAEAVELSWLLRETEEDHIRRHRDEFQMRSFSRTSDVATGIHTILGFESQLHSAIYILDILTNEGKDKAYDACDSSFLPDGCKHLMFSRFNQPSSDGAPLGVMCRSIEVRSYVSKRCNGNHGPNDSRDLHKKLTTLLLADYYGACEVTETAMKHLTSPLGQAQIIQRGIVKGFTEYHLERLEAEFQQLHPFATEFLAMEKPIDFDTCLEYLSRLPHKSLEMASLDPEAITHTTFDQFYALRGTWTFPAFPEFFTAVKAYVLDYESEKTMNSQGYKLAPPLVRVCYEKAIEKLRVADKVAALEAIVSALDVVKNGKFAEGIDLTTCNKIPYVPTTMV